MTRTEFFSPQGDWFLRSHRQDLANDLGEYIFRANPQLMTRHGTVGLESTQREMEQHLASLFNTMVLDSPQVFAEDLTWFRSNINRSDLDDLQFEPMLDQVLHFLKDALPEEEANHVLRFIARARRGMAHTPERGSYITETNPFRELALRILDLIVDERRRLASALAYSAVESGISLSEFYLHVLQPVQYEVGRLWEAGQISVSAEHYTTTATLSIMSELYPLALTGEDAPERVAVIVAVGTDTHTLGVRMLGDLMEADGWTVHLLVNRNHPQEIVRALSNFDADLLAISVTMSRHLLQAGEIIDAVQCTDHQAATKIMVGGRPFELDQNLWRKFGANGWAVDAPRAVQMANLLVEERALDRSDLSRRPHGPGTIWWLIDKGPETAVVRDELGLSDLIDGNEEFDLSRLLDSLDGRTAPLKAPVLLAGPGEPRRSEIYFDAHRHHDRWVIAASHSIPDVEALIDDGIRTAQALEKTLNIASLQREDASAQIKSQLPGLAGLYSEITTLQRELVTKTISLEEIQRDRDRLLAMAAHDMRNALTAIDANSFLLEELLGDLEIPGDVYHHLQAISRSSGYLLKLTADLQELASLETASLTCRPIDPLPLIVEGVDDARAVAAGKNITVELHTGDDLPPASLDTTLFRRLLGNLLSNALKFSPPHSTVYVEASASEERLILTVRDEGPGISPKEIEQLFDLFFLGKARPTGGERSTGLGLPIVKRIVDAHQGEIDIDSTVGEGTAFTVSLPL